MNIRTLEKSDWKHWLNMRKALWSELDNEELESDMTRILSDDSQVAFGAFINDELIGLTEFSLHPHAACCKTSPVAYLEAWYVSEEHRRSGIGKSLVDAGIKWGKEKGCTEMASDTWLDNDTSNKAHLAAGFKESIRLVHYQRNI